MKIDSEETKYIKIDVSENPKGVEKMVAKQREKEKKGRFVKAGIKTWTLVGNHEDAEKRITRFNERINQPFTR